jgi:hypothetical protein
MHGIVSIGTLCRTVQMAADVERRGGGGLRVDDSDRPNDEQDDIGEEELQRRYYERLSDWTEPGKSRSIGAGSWWNRPSSRIGSSRGCADSYSRRMRLRSQSQRSWPAVLMKPVRKISTTAKRTSVTSSKGAPFATHWAVTRAGSSAFGRCGGPSHGGVSRHHPFVLSACRTTLG